MAGQGATAEQIAISLRCEETAKQNMIKQKELKMQGIKNRVIDVRHSLHCNRTYCEIEGFGS